MATSLVSDIVDGASLTLTQQGNYQVTRVMILQDVVGASADAVLYAAVTDPLIPIRGTAHPSISGLSVDTITATPLDTGNIQVVILYKNQTAETAPPDAQSTGQISVGATVQSKTLTVDANNNTMWLYYTKPDGSFDARIVGEVEVQLPQVALKFSRREVNSPEYNAIRFVGTVNNGFWHGQPARRWLCTRIEGTSTDGLYYQTDYEFQLTLGGWDATLYYIDPATNEVPPDVIPGNGITTFQVYPSSNFGELNFI